MTKIAILGASSFLSTYIISGFNQEAFELTLYSRSNSNNHFKFELFDYPNIIPDFKDLLEYDVIIYCAAAGVQSSVKNTSDEVYGLNTFLPIRIINYLNDNNYLGKFISFGSYFEIGAQNELKGFTEKEVVFSENKVPNSYCLSKRIFTRYVHDVLNSCKHYHLILPSIYGKGENSNRLIPYLVNSLKNNNSLELTAGNQIRQFLHARDVSSFVQILIKEDCTPGIYNLATQHNYVSDVVKILFDLFKRDSNDSLGKIQKMDESMKILLLDDSISRSTGWYPRVSLIEGILEYV